MTLIVTVLQIVAPVFLLALIGVVWVRLGYDYSVRFVTRLSMTLGVPCLIFVALMETEIDKGALQAIVWASVLGYVAVTVILWLVVLIARLDIQTYLAPLIFGNTGNLGLPLALFAFGDTGLGYAVIVFAVMGIFHFTFGLWLVSGGGSIFKVLQEPLVWATIAGGVFLWNDWETPIWITNTVRLVGQMAIPLMLITLGVALARITPSSVWRALVLSTVKVVVCVAAAYVAGRIFQLEQTALAVLILQISTPVAVTSYLLAEKYGADADEVAGLTVVSTLLSVVSIPLTLAFFV